MVILKGTRSRPRVALVGTFEQDTYHAFEKLFPTIWVSKCLTDLEVSVSCKEIDLIIIGPSTDLSASDYGYLDFLSTAHVICFSKIFPYLPGPSDNSHIRIVKDSSTEEYLIPKLSLSFYSLLESDLASSSNAKGWPLLDIDIKYRNVHSVSTQRQNKVFLKGKLLSDPHTGLPFATVFRRLDSKLFIAWLPNDFFSIVSWVELICTYWAKSDRIRFPYFGDWTKNTIWMTQEEKTLTHELDILNLELTKITAEIEEKIRNTQKALTHTSLMANKGKRKLITAQGTELLIEVANSFKGLGYSVRIIDDELKKGSPRIEDLRIKDPDLENWEAIVEVRGHSKSSGQPSDLIRLSKFASLYRNEVGREPDKLIYVINGQIDLLPDQRQEPFASAIEELIEFGEQGGLVIWSVDLYIYINSPLVKDNLTKARKSIRESKGRWSNRQLNQYQ